MYVCMYVCMYMYVYICIRMYVCMYVCTCMQEAAAGVAAERRRALRLRGVLARASRRTLRWRPRAHVREVRRVQAEVRAFVRMLENL